MNWSAVVSAEVPALVVTVTSTVPVPVGLVAVIVVLESNLTRVDAVVPKFTLEPAVNPVPVMVTAVPPATGPLAGAMPVTETEGGGRCVTGMPVPVRATFCGCWREAMKICRSAVYGPGADGVKTSVISQVAVGRKSPVHGDGGWVAD